MFPRLAFSQYVYAKLFNSEVTVTTVIKKMLKEKKINVYEIFKDRPKLYTSEMEYRSLKYRVGQTIHSGFHLDQINSWPILQQ